VSITTHRFASPDWDRPALAQRPDFQADTLYYPVPSKGPTPSRALYG
jgi:hypothetical protein